MKRKIILFVTAVIFQFLSNYANCGCLDGCYVRLNQNFAAARQYLEIVPQNIVSSSREMVAFWEKYFNTYLNVDPQAPQTYPKFNSQYYSPVAYDTFSSKQQEIADSLYTITQSTINDCLAKDPNANMEKTFSNLKIAPQKIHLNTNFGFPTSPANSTLNNHYLNINSFLYPASYAFDSTNSIAGIKYIDITNAMIKKPFAMRYPEELTSKEPKMNNNMWYIHLTNRWHLIANKMVAFSNLYNILLEKIHDPDLRNNILIPPNTSLPAKISYSEADKYLQNYLITTPEWNQDVKTNVSLPVEREMVFTLAKFYQNLYNKYQKKERLLATITAYQILSLDMYKDIIQAKTSSNIISSPNFLSPQQSNNMPNITFSDEEEDEKETQVSPSSAFCFIASSIYGENSWQVQKLRKYRDENMTTTLVGNAAVKLYYIVSPDITAFFNRHPHLKPPVKEKLDAFIRTL